MVLRTVIWEMRCGCLEVITLAHEILHTLNTRLEEKVMSYIFIQE